MKVESVNSQTFFLFFDRNWDNIALKKRLLWIIIGQLVIILIIKIQFVIINDYIFKTTYSKDQQHLENTRQTFISRIQVNIKHKGQYAFQDSFKSN